MKIISIFSFIVLLVGCSVHPAEVNKNYLNAIELSLWSNFSLTSEVKFTKKYVRDDGSVAWLNYDDNFAHRKIGDVLIEVFSLDKRTAPNGCESISLGASKIEIGNEYVYGKVDIWDDAKIEGFEDYAALTKVKCLKSHIDKNESIYSMCSNKNNSTIVVCVRQQENNRRLPEEIFRTFKWTE